MQVVSSSIEGHEGCRWSVALSVTLSAAMRNSAVVRMNLLLVYMYGVSDLIITIWLVFGKRGREREEGREGEGEEQASLS